MAVVEAVEVKSFVGRWKVIKTRLELLSLQLAELADAPCFKEHALSTELLESVVSSLKEARELAKLCTDLTYGGKLQMQSNLDSLATKLNLYFRDCQLMIKSGMLRENAPVLSKSSSGAAKEAVKWSVNDLLARLQIGSVDSKIKALTTLIVLMNEDDKIIIMVAAQGGIPPLVRLLDASIPVMREKAAVAICSLATVDNFEQRLLMEGALAPMVRLLESGSALANEKAAMTLQCLTHILDYGRYVASHGGIPALLETCRTGTPGAQAAAAGSLRNLSLIPEIRECMSEEGAISVLLYLISSGTALCREHAAATLQNLSQNSEYWQQLIVSQGGISPLLRFLDVSDDPVGQEVGIGVLRNVAASSANIETLLSEGIVQQLAGFLVNSSHMVQEAAAAIVCSIGTSTKIRKSIAEAGCIPPLLKMLDAKTNTAQEYAIQALSSLFLVDSNRKLFLAEKSGVADIVQLLDSHNQITVDSAVSALNSLAGSGKCRKRMVSAGACCYLERLAGKRTLGTKKLLEQLGGGRIRSMLKKLDLLDR
ncbi:hypothetical protein O6H91_02G079700 [Diphasiastrum complanatum]|nr:hypothetical protein O6H91_02G079700 [Diphasiastrum complanatum]